MRRGVLVALVGWVALAAGCGSDAKGAGPRPPEDPPPPPGDPKPPAFQFGTQGPWAIANAIYGAAEGLQEARVVGFTTDEAQNRWLATPSALYLLKPGETALRRYGAEDGLHLAQNPARYCRDRPIGRDERCNPADESWGAASEAGILSLAGGGPGEVFVGYWGNHSWAYDCKHDGNGVDNCDPDRHSGKIDRVRLNADGTLTVDRLDLVANNHGAQYWHDRIVWRLVYDHLHHPGTLYAGTDHGVAILFPERFRLPRPGEWFDLAYQEWMGDHLHARVCFEKPCVPGSSANQRMGDWRGLAVDGAGDLWHAGKWTAGLITWQDDPQRWWTRGGGAFEHAFGDPYSGPGSPNVPVFPVPREGHDVNLTAVAVCPDGRTWFASSGPEAVEATVAAFDGRAFSWYTAGQLGLAERPVKDLVCLPDGRLVVAGFATGLTVHDPATGKSTPIRASGGLIPSDRIEALELDTMAKPPTLHVSTGRGAAALRVLP